VSMEIFFVLSIFVHHPHAIKEAVESVWRGLFDVLVKEPELGNRHQEGRACILVLH
jgi:hypothetical protein